MPYGVDKDQGGDSPGNVKWMEKCVSSISGTNKRTGKPYTEGEKIAICKSQLKKNKSKSESMDNVEVDEDTFKLYDIFREQYIRKVMTELKVDNTLASEMFKQHLKANGNNLFK